MTLGLSSGGRPFGFTLLETTSGLPDDDRRADEHERARVEAEGRGRARAALGALSAHPEARERVMRDQTRLRLFCARFSVSPRDICPLRDQLTPAGTRCPWCRSAHGGFRPIHIDDLSEVLSSPADRLAELRAREGAVLPGAAP